MFLSNLSVRRPVFAAVMMLALVALGIASYRRLSVDLFPSVEIPVISIVTLYEGASPEAVEREVTKRIEEAVNPVAGVGKVNLVGAATREVQIDIDPARLQALGLGIDEVASGLRSENVDTPLGRLTDGARETALRVEGKARRVADLRSMVVAHRGD